MGWKGRLEAYNRRSPETFANTPSGTVERLLESRCLHVSQWNRSTLTLTLRWGQEGVRKERKHDMSAHIERSVDGSTRGTAARPAPEQCRDSGREKFPLNASSSSLVVALTLYQQPGGAGGASPMLTPLRDRCNPAW